MRSISSSPEKEVRVRLDGVTAEIRPRSDWESVDLGLAMIRRDFWRSLALWWLGMMPYLLIGGWLMSGMPLLFLFGFWWMKPAGSRMVLHQISRRLFGEIPRWSSLLREVPRATWRRFFHRFFITRLSPWLPVTLAVCSLEGLRGKPYNRRVSEISRRGHGAMMAIYLLADFAAFWLGMAVFLIGTMFIPEGQEGPWTDAVASWDPEEIWNIPPLITWSFTASMMIAISLVDLFVTGAGFGIYVNNRTWLEGWDVELAFRRMTQRLTKALGLILLLLVGFFSCPLEAQEVENNPPEAANVVKEVKEHPDFKIHKVKQKVPETSGNSLPTGLLSVMQVFSSIIGWASLAAVVAFVAWLIWRFRHVLVFRGEVQSLSKPAARVVMGMDITPESLPDDIPGTAWKWWTEGRHQEAMSLLYRGAISRAVNAASVEIEPSDTEGDCLRRVKEAGATAQPAYFQGLTNTWIALAYGGRQPQSDEVRSLCQSWPFQERRPA